MVKVALTTLLFLALLAPLPSPVAAAVYCVSNSDELLAATSAAQASINVDDEIRLRVGNYVRQSTSALQISITGSQALEISGGWSGANGTCTQQAIGAEATRFIGIADNFQLAGIRYSGGTFGSVTLDNLEFQGSQSSPDEAGGCIDIGPTGTGGTPSIVLDRLVLRSCRGTFGAALYAQMTGGELRIRGSRIAGNTSQVSAAIYIQASDSNIYIANNTMTDNRNTPGMVGGLALDGSGIFWVGNNVLWGNVGNTDLQLAPNTNLVRNHLGSVAGATSGIVNGTTTGDPRFVGQFDFTPRADSPLRNSGNNSVAGGVTNTDLNGNPRILEGLVDRGAYEYEPFLFANGFE
jgi:hypothetical protein